MNSKNTNDQVSLKEYNNTIREMINHENEIRNQRTNWFLIIQGFLIAGLCDLSSKSELNGKALVVLIIAIGIITSFSFLYAAWRSTLAIDYALSCWKEFLGNVSEDNYPPVSLITKEILDARDYSSESRKKRIYNRMYEEKSECRKSLDDRLNDKDYLLPYKLLPIIFFLGWIGYGIYIYILIY